MSEKYRNITGKAGHWLLSAVLALAFLPQALPLYAAEQPEELSAEYIVKYREEISFLMDGEDTEPFDVVGKAELRRLLRADALEWYEEDGDAVLLETEPWSAAEMMDQNGNEGNPEADAGTGSPDEDDAGASQSPAYYDAEEQWNLGVIRADLAFRHHYLGQGIRIGVIDSGVSPHSDFGNRLLQGRNFMEEAQDDPVKAADTADEYGHGTRVAGLAIAASESGYIGAAPAAEIVPLKCTDGQKVKISAICRAIYAAIDEYHCNVLNLSLGIATEYESLKEAVAYAEEEGVVVVSAVGNGGETTVYYPAAYDSVIGVGSVDRAESLYRRSNHNSSVFLTAPGVEVRSTDRYGGYQESTGCSFAIPQVSGAAAVLLGIDGSLTPEEIRQIFSETATDRGAEGYDEYYGYGILNLGGCVASLTGSDEDPEDPPENPSQPSDSPGNPVQPDPSEELNPVDEPDPGEKEPATDPENPSTPSNPSDSRQQPGDSSGNEGNGSSGTPSSGQTDPDKPSGTDEPVKPADPDQPSVTPPPADPPDAPDEPAASWKACARDAGCVLNGFTDLDRNAWYHDGVHYVLEKGIMNGCGDQIFRPDRDTSRAMIVTMLWRMEGSPQTSERISFKDVPEDQWYTQAVRWAASGDLVNGYSRTAFGPDDRVSREQLAAILWRYARYKGIATGSGTTDLLGQYTDTEQISGWALEAMRWTVSNGLIQGVDEEHLQPGGSAVRAQTAMMLMRFEYLTR